MKLFYNKAEGGKKGEWKNNNGTDEYMDWKKYSGKERRIFT